MFGGRLSRDPVSNIYRGTATFTALGAGPITASSNIAPDRHPLQRADWESEGDTVFRHACKLGLKGIASKRKAPPYSSGRSPAQQPVRERSRNCHQTPDRLGRQAISLERMHEHRQLGLSQEWRQTGYLSRRSS